VKIKVLYISLILGGVKAENFICNQFIYTKSDFFNQLQIEADIDLKQERWNRRYIRLLNNPMCYYLWDKEIIREEIIHKTNYQKTKKQTLENVSTSIIRFLGVMSERKIYSEMRTLQTECEEIRCKDTLLAKYLGQNLDVFYNYYFPRQENHEFPLLVFEKEKTKYGEHKLFEVIKFEERIIPIENIAPFDLM